MASNSLPSLFTDIDRYLKAHRTYSSFCGRLGMHQAWVESDLFSEAVLGRLQARLDGQEGLRVLGVGSGAGEIDYFMFKRLLRKYPRIDNRVVEPCGAKLDRYKALVNSEAHQLHGVTCDWRQQTIEQYQKAGDSTKFHFISAIYVLYHMDTDDALDNCLTYLYSRLEEGGVMLILMRTDDCGHTRLLNDIKPFHENFHDVTSGDVRSWLDRQGVAYTQHRQALPMNITACFDRASEEGDLLLDFLTFTVGFREAATEDLQSRVMERLASGDCSEKNGDEIWLNMDWDALVVTKPMGE